MIPPSTAEVGQLWLLVQICPATGFCRLVNKEWLLHFQIVIREKAKKKNILFVNFNEITISVSINKV